MSVSDILPNAGDVRAISAQLARLNSIEKARAIQEGVSLPDVFWHEVKEIAEGGNASRHYSIGSQFIDKYTDVDNTNPVVYSNPFDVLDFKNVIKHTGETVPGIIIGSHYASLVSVQYSGWPAFIYSNSGLPAGTYNFTVETTWGKLTAGTYQFTLVNALPAGGQIVGVKRWSNVDMQNWAFEVYASATSTTLIETVNVIPGNSGTQLGVANPEIRRDVEIEMGGSTHDYHINGYQKAAYGTDRWRDSAIRQYLNSQAPAGQWWIPQDGFDRAPEIAQTKSGWLAGLPEELRNILTPVKVTTAVTNAEAALDPDYLFDITYDKVWLPSLEEHFIEPQLQDAEGSALEYWKEIYGTTGPAPTGIEIEDFKTGWIQDHSVLRPRWLRSANRFDGCTNWRITEAGSVSQIQAASVAYPQTPCMAIC